MTVPRGEQDEEADSPPSADDDDPVPEAVAWLPVDMSRVDVAEWLAIE
jgi:hypothetical protein